VEPTLGHREISPRHLPRSQGAVSRCKRKLVLMRFKVCSDRPIIVQKAIHSIQNTLRRNGIRYLQNYIGYGTFARSQAHYVAKRKHCHY
jgi:hypothetical protein